MLGDVRVLAAHASPSAPAASDAAAGAVPDVTELLLDTERSSLQALFDMIRRFKVGYEVELHKRTLESGLLALIGPQALAIAAAADARLLELGEREHDHRLAEIDGIPARVVRTDVGLDLLCAAEQTAALSNVLQRRGAHPVSLEAVECLRIEHGRPRYGIDLDDSVIPQEAALNERAVSFTKGCYVGQETVARLHWRGKPNRHLRGLRLSEPVASGAELRLGERVVGHLSSSAVSPRLGPIALALVRREAPPGTTLAVGVQGASAEVLELPLLPATATAASLSEAESER